jgi:adenylate cyclase
MNMSWLPISIIALATAGLTLTVQYAGLFQILEWAVYDRLFSLRPRDPTDETSGKSLRDRLLIVTIDEADIQNAGQWPLVDANLVRLVRTLQKYNPAVIGLDLYRNLPIEPGHAEWETLLKSTPNVICVEKGIGLQVPPPPAIKDSDRLALTDLLVDADGKVRRALLSHPLPDGNLRLGLGTKLALDYLEKQGITLEELDPVKKRYRLGKSTFVPFDGNDGGYVRTNSGGYQILLNYGGHLETFRAVSLTQVLEQPLDPAWVRDRIVLVGSIAPSLNDFFYTPLSSRLANTPQAVPGIVLHANIASQLLGAALDGRSSIRTLPEPLEWLWIAVWSSIGVIVPWQLLTTSQEKPLAYRGRVVVVCGFLGSSLLFLGSYGAFLLNWWVPTISPLVASMASATVVTISHLRKLQQEREELKYKQFQLESDRIRAEAASQAKSQFLANISHELRTPLNAILGFTQIISRDPELNGSHQEYLEIIYRSSEHLLELIDDILDLSKIEAGRMSLEESDFDLLSTIESAVALFQNQAEQKGLQLVIQLQPDVPKYVRGDRKKLRSCLVNPLSNAMKFTQEGRISIRVSSVFHPIPLERQRTNHKEPITIHFEIQDTGMGIAPEECDRVFDAFVQTQTGRQSATGTGLGLAITRQFVQLMGGEISVHSVVGEGTTIAFNVMVMPLEMEPEKVEMGQSRVIGFEPGQPAFRILVVDNDADSQLLLVTLLNQIGFEVRSAEDGLKAVEIWESWQPHLIWMNVRMPMMDGLTATRQIRERERNQKRDQPTVIIAMTASQGESVGAAATQESHHEILAAGCDHVVGKPILEAIALDTIARYLGVCYRYESLSVYRSSSRSLAEVESLLSDQLGEMPILWVRSLNQAANEVNETLVFQLIDQIPDNRVQLAESLLSLTNDFRLDTIVRLTQSVLRDS